MERSTIDLWVGLFMVAGLGALTILALKVGNMGSLGSSDTYQLSAEFTNIGGLKPRAAVKSSGVVVGRVAGISFDNDKFVARVTMNIDSRYKFPQDTSASILTAGLLGEQYVGFEGGAEDKPLAPGATLKLTQSAVVLEKLISQFMYNKAADGSGSSK
ncbi:MAG: outer membrane lipid asymmetry maintenance protein MlaD [Betaproteobacteria bacterium]|jgi:phospholipid/cholesterol/gamma-HCH transport system substrate-binding protein|nr:outer membrane lipid asymmetry maintenance protein MlaD [Betaproteobacteria bacterium]